MHREVPVREDTYPEPSAYEVGWPQGIESDSKRRSSAREACAPTTMPPRPYKLVCINNVRMLMLFPLINKFFAFHLTVGCRKVFGSIIERNVILLVDVSGSMVTSIDELKRELEKILWQQIHKHKIK